MGYGFVGCFYGGGGGGVDGILGLGILRISNFHTFLS